jgi:hypothetical protein
MNHNTIGNNLMTKPSGGLVWIGGTNNGGMNLYNVDPEFVSAPIAAEFNFADNYMLTANSPGKNYGTDGTDIGIYGGNRPWPNGSGSGYVNAAMPPIPQIISVDIYNPIIPVGTPLQVQIKTWSQH